MNGVFIYLAKTWRESLFYKDYKSCIKLLYSPVAYISWLMLYFYNCVLGNTKVVKTNFSLNSKFKNNVLFNNTNEYYFVKTNWNFLKKNKFFLFIDYIYLLLLKEGFNTNNNNFFELRSRVRLKQVSWSFYNKFSDYNFKSKYPLFYSSHYLSGLRYVWVGLKYWFLGLIIGLFVFYYLTYIRLLPFNKVIFEWLLVIMFLYWLLSGFVFFIKKYQYSKFTTVIQRFWKRSFILFWLIESFTFIIFFYLIINAPEEPFYMYDQIKVFKTHLFSWKLFLPKIVPVISLMILGYYLLLSLKWTTFSKQVPVLVVLTLTLIYVFWLEFYQFFHLINYYEEYTWVFDNDEFFWNLDKGTKRTRISNNLVTIGLIAKFWHLVFIFVFWIFFILRVNEIGRVRYPLLAANLQNFIFVYIMSWLYMYPWLKFAFRRHLETQYFWFFYNARRLGIRVFFNDLYLFISGFFRNFSFNNLTGFNTNLFYYWIESSKEQGLLQYKKHIIKDLVISNLNSKNLSNTSLFLKFNLL